MKQLIILYTNLSDVILTKRNTRVQDITIDTMNSNATKAINKSDIWVHRHYIHSEARLMKIHTNKIKTLKAIIRMAEKETI